MARESHGYVLIKNCWKFLFFFALSSCLTQVDLGTDNIGGRLVISGQISTIADQNIIQVGTTADTERLPFPLSGAWVSVTDEQSEEIHLYSEDPFSPGSYILEDFQGTPGRSYYLTVIAPNGREYRSDSQQIPDDVGTIGATFDFNLEQYTDFEGIVTEQPFMKIYASSVVPSSDSPIYLKWQVDEAFLLSPTDFPDPFGSVPPPCFIVQNADPQRIVVLNGEFLNVSNIDNLLVCSRIVDWSFLEKHTFSLVQTSFSKNAFAYWQNVHVLANQVGSIFDTPPAEIKGNILSINLPGEKVYGYFQAVNQVYTRFTTYPNDLPFPVPYNACTYSYTRNEYPSRCLDCSLVRNSTSRRPVWF